MRFLSCQNFRALLVWCLNLYFPFFAFVARGWNKSEEGAYRTTRASPEKGVVWWKNSQCDLYCMLSSIVKVCIVLFGGFCVICNIVCESLQFVFEFVRIMIACLSFLLDYEKFEDDDSDASSSEDEAPHTPQLVLNRESIYKVSFALFL